MGIRFFCPNGHRLHVKAFQAGRRGVCPYCGEKTQIPTESTRPSSKKARASDNADVEEAGPDEFPPASEPASPGVPMAELSSADSIPAPEPAAVEVDDEISPQTPIFSNVAPSPHPLATEDRTPDARTSPAPAMPDPLAEEPHAVWYVRPSAGGQFGPAASDVMRTWLEDGRVSDDSLVWREGWRDWEKASSVFAQLAAERLPTINKAPSRYTTTAAPSGEPNFSSGLPSEPTSSPPSGLTRRNARQRRSNTTAKLIIAGLALAVIALIIALVWVIRGQNAEPDAGAPEPGAVSAAFVSRPDDSAVVA